MKLPCQIFTFFSNASFVLLLLLGFSCSNEKEIEIDFAFGPTEASNVQPLIDRFNKLHKGEIQINWKKTAVVSDEYYQQIEDDFVNEKQSFDLIGGDVVWTAPFAEKKWIKDLSTAFYQNYEPEDFVNAAMNSATYNFKIWGVPWFTDAGILFYRKDLLEKSGFTKAPETWSSLIEMARKAQADHNIEYGYVFQGADYEGGVANACEFIWNAGGNVLLANLGVSGDFGQVNIDPDIIIVDSKESEAGLGIARTLINEGVSPREVANFKEAESTQAFMEGKAVFMRGWPGIYNELNSDQAKISSAQLGMSAIPVLVDNTPSYSCLGGWNFMIARHVTEKEEQAIWTFIKFMTAPEQQRFRALEAGILPAIDELYQDEDLLEKVPTMALAKEVIQNTRVRPISPNYMEFAPKISEIYHQVLTGQLAPEYAVSYLQMELEMVASH